MYPDVTAAAGDVSCGPGPLPRTRATCPECVGAVTRTLGYRMDSRLGPLQLAFGHSVSKLVSESIGTEYYDMHILFRSRNLLERPDFVWALRWLTDGSQWTARFSVDPFRAQGGRNGGLALPSRRQRAWLGPLRR